VARGLLEEVNYNVKRPGKIRGGHCIKLSYKILVLMPNVQIT